MSAKPRSDAKLLNLPHHQQDALASWLMEEGLSYAAAKERLHMDFGVSTSEAALSSFWQRVCAPRHLRQAAEAAEAFAGSAGGLGTNWSDPSRAMIRQKFFELSAARSVVPRDLMAFAAMVSAIDQGELEREKLAFQRAKHAETLKQKDEALRLAREKFEDQRMKAAAELEKLRKPAGEPLPEAERTAILDKVDEILGIRKGGG